VVLISFYVINSFLFVTITVKDALYNISTPPTFSMVFHDFMLSIAYMKIDQINQGVKPWNLSLSTP